jgi:hypothetical protein
LFYQLSARHKNCKVLILQIHTKLEYKFVQPFDDFIQLVNYVLRIY